MAKDIYRKSLLERMSSPDQLDKMIVITSPTFWLALLGGAVIVIVALIWSIFGRLPVNLEATGMYLPDQTAFTLASDTAGIVSSVEVQVGEQVKVGDVLLTLSDEAVQKELDALLERRDKVEAVTLSSINDEATADNRELINIKTQMGYTGSEGSKNSAMLSQYQSELSALSPQVDAAKKKMDDAKNAYYNAMKTSPQDQINLTILQSEYSNASSEYNALYSQASNLEANILSIEAQQKAADVGAAEQNSNYEQQFKTTRAAILDGINAEIEKYELSMEKNKVRASVSGQVTDVKAGVGSAVGQGAEIATIRQISGEDQIICYIPLNSGKKVEQGMKVIVTPTTVKRQEYGHMEAEVIRVDEYITSASSIRATLGDETLTQAFTQNGPLIAVTCRLRTDETTASGYWWSNKKGRELTIQEGTMVTADIITEDKAPISMLIPYVKEKLTMAVEPKEDGESGSNSKEDR